MTLHEIPSLTGRGLTIERRLQTRVNCPGCETPLDITDVKAGATIKCNNCGNVTWTPEYTPRWWYKTRNFVASVTASVVIGVIASLIASYLWQNTGLEVKNRTSEVSNNVD